MELVKVKLNQELQYGTKRFKAGEVGEIPEGDYLSLKKQGINIELVKEEVKEKNAK